MDNSVRRDRGGPSENMPLSLIKIEKQLSEIAVCPKAGKAIQKHVLEADCPRESGFLGRSEGTGMV